MTLSPDELAARYDDPYRRTDRFEISADRFEKGLERGDDGNWGVGAFVAQRSEALFVREGETWLLPGGRLESGESPEEGVRREVREETGVEIDVVELAAISEQTFVRTGDDESYEFYFATFFGLPRGSSPDPVPEPSASAIDEVAWRRAVPRNTFDQALVTQLFEAYV